MKCQCAIKSAQVLREVVRGRAEIQHFVPGPQIFFDQIRKPIALLDAGTKGEGIADDDNSVAIGSFRFDLAVAISKSVARYMRMGRKRVAIQVSRAKLRNAQQDNEDNPRERRSASVESQNSCCHAVFCRHPRLVGRVQNEVFQDRAHPCPLPIKQA